MNHMYKMMRIPPSVRHVLFACLGGVLLGIGSRFTPLWMFSLVAFAPIAYVPFTARSIRSVFLYMLLAGAVAYGFSLHALFFDALPLTWLGIGDGVGVFLIVLVWTISVALFALAFAAAMAIAYAIRTGTPWDIVLIACAYAISDWVGAWLFSLINYGPGALLGPHFTMGSPAYQLAADQGLSQAAFVGGVYALAFVQAGIGALIYYLWHTRKNPSVHRVLTGVSAIVLVSWAVLSFALPFDVKGDAGADITVGLATLYRPAVLYPSKEQTEAVFDTLLQQLVSVSPDADIIVLPEDARFLSRWHERAAEGETLPLPSVTIIDSGATREQGGGLYSRIEALDARTNSTQFSYKQYLMLFGEYMPYLYESIGRAVGQDETVDTLQKTRGFKRRGIDTPITADSAALSVLLCSEAMSPTLYADAARQGATVFINLASHSWFNGSRTLYQVAKWNGQVRAIESRRWYARSSDGTPSFVLDPYGRTLVEGKWGDQSILYGTVYPRSEMTPYVLLGQWVVVVPFAIMSLFGMNLVRKRFGPYSVGSRTKSLL